MLFVSVECVFLMNFYFSSIAHSSSYTNFYFKNQVGADGANSMVRKQMNVNHFSLSYDQMGLIATVELEQCENNFVAWQRFLPNGVIALLPVSDQLSSIVWSTGIKHFKQLMQLNDSDFIDAVNNAFVRILFRTKIVHSFIPFIL